MSTVRRCIGATVAALAAGALAATPASALEPGVHVDPGSPAAKEYAIPLGQARQLGGVENHSASSETKLFGAGIRRAGGGPGTGAGGHSHSSAHAGGAGAGGGGGGSSGGSTGGPGTSASDNGARLPASVLRAVHEHPSGDSSLLVLIGGGVAILVLGGFGGTVLRHRRPQLRP